MQTESSNKHIWLPSRARYTLRAHPLAVRFGIILLLSAIMTLLAYQTRPRADIRVGWFGDRMFLAASPGLGAADVDSGRWYGDELTADSPSGRARWTRTHAVVDLPHFGGSGPAELAMLVQGWPADAIRAPGQPAQPTVTVLANGLIIGSFTPTVSWAIQKLTIPAQAFQGSDLRIELQSQQSFTDTSAATDVRPKVVRVAHIQVNGGVARNVVLPPLQPVLLLMLVGLAVYIGFSQVSRQPDWALAGALVAIVICAVALATVRAWAGALLPWVVSGLMLVLVFVCAIRWRSLLADFARRFERTGVLGLGFGAALLCALAYLALRSVIAADGVSLTLLGALLLAFAAGLQQRLAGGAAALAAWLNSRRGAILILSTFLVIWLGYQAWIVAVLPGAGHADYSDNAVVARNLVRGRGWVVDYVTQFYQLYPRLTRPQETWPLLQPVWIAPFFAVFGPHDWAAKLPNLVFLALLGVLVYRFATRVWDRRIGMTAAILLLTSYLFFRLAINVTSDLGFVLLSFTVIGLVYDWGMDGRRLTVVGNPFDRRPSIVHRRFGIPILGLLTGLMLLQKPANGVFVAAGCGVWLVWRLLGDRQTGRQGDRETRRRGDRNIAAFRLSSFVFRLSSQISDLRRSSAVGRLIVWTAITLVIFAPYLVRNLALSRQNDHLYGSLVYSTESRDAWVWGFAPDSDEIYKIYTPAAGLSETQGLPDRSWILRWGFDRTVEKIIDQVEAVRDYLFPVWTLPNNWSQIVSGNASKRLFFAVGAWLSLLGLLSIVRGRNALTWLLGLAFVPYTMFLVVYWHANEERYFVALMPWLALLAALAIWRIYGWLAILWSGRLAPMALAVAVTLIAAIVAPSGPKIGEQITIWHRADSDRLAYAWLREHTEPDEAVMTRVPWQLNWHAERPALMIPATTNRQKLLQLARYYKIRYLMFDVGQRPDPPTQKMLEQMVADQTLTTVYTSPTLYLDKPSIVYRFPADYGGVSELRP